MKLCNSYHGHQITNLLAFLHFARISYGEIKEIWKFPVVNTSTKAPVTNLTMEESKNNSSCYLSTAKNKDHMSVTIQERQVVFMTDRCVAAYCRDPIRDRGVGGLLFIECRDVFGHIHDLGLDTVSLLEDECNACKPVTVISTSMPMTNTTEEEKSNWWWSLSWNFWRSSISG